MTKGTNINKEILNTEIKMIENGIIPSVFFRFPGLISDEDMYKHVMSYGLIPIGANAWLAKSEIPGQGTAMNPWALKNSSNYSKKKIKISWLRNGVC